MPQVKCKDIVMEKVSENLIVIMGYLNVLLDHLNVFWIYGGVKCILRILIWNGNNLRTVKVC